jgi:hypothetical protein
MNVQTCNMLLTAHIITFYYLQKFSLLLVCGCLKCVHLFHGPPLWSSGHSSWLHNGDVLSSL